MKQNIIFRLIGFYLNAIHCISPRYATDITYKLFCTPPKRVVKKRELEIMRQAIVRRKNFKRKYKLKRSIGEYIKYTWGEGPLVLLVHGWGGRASNLASHFKHLIFRPSSCDPEHMKCKVIFARALRYGFEDFI